MRKPLKTLMRLVVRCGLRSVRSVYRKSLEINVRSGAFGARAQPPHTPLWAGAPLGEGAPPYIEGNYLTASPLSWG